MNQLRITMFQTDIVWNNKDKNLCCLREKLCAIRGTTEIVVLPEMFSTGFTMQSDLLAEPMSGNTIDSLKSYAAQFEIAICGSFICKDGNGYYNRGFFITPDQQIYYYDKHHLFRMGDEQAHFSSGHNQLIFSYKGWNICLLVCYDLRFPVWSRNVDNSYDLLIYVANWPQARRRVWDALLLARALENQAYVCGVNRVGIDGNHLQYSGGSVIYSPKGDKLNFVPDNQEGHATQCIDLDSLHIFRQKFPVWMDADTFIIENP